MDSKSSTVPFTKRRWVRNVTEALLIAVALLGIRAWTQRGTASGPAPEVVGTSLDGKRVALSELRGRPVLVQFWATWCSVCKMEHGSIQDVSRDYDVLTVASGSGSAAKVAAFMKAEGLSYPVVVDPEGELARRFGVKSFPSSFFVTSDGRIRFTEIGYTTELGMRARLWLAGR